VDPAKVEAIREWHALKNVPEVRNFMGLAGYYQQFVEGFSKITIQLRNCKEEQEVCVDREMRGSISKAQGDVDDSVDTKSP
jgi:hypothetical protein